MQEIWHKVDDNGALPNFSLTYSIIEVKILLHGTDHYKTTKLSDPIIIDDMNSP